MAHCTPVSTVPEPAALLFLTLCVSPLQPHAAITPVISEGGSHLVGLQCCPYCSSLPHLLFLTLCISPLHPDAAITPVISESSAHFIASQCCPYCSSLPHLLLLTCSVLNVQDDAAITPVISESSANFIEGLVKDAEKKGATLCQKYKREDNLIWPLLLDHVNAVSCQPLPRLSPMLRCWFTPRTRKLRTSREGHHSLSGVSV